MTVNFRDLSSLHLWSWEWCAIHFHIFISREQYLTRLTRWMPRVGQRLCWESIWCLCCYIPLTCFLTNWTSFEERNHIFTKVWLRCFHWVRWFCRTKWNESEYYRNIPWAKFHHIGVISVSFTWHSVIIDCLCAIRWRYPLASFRTVNGAVCLINWCKLCRVIRHVLTLNETSFHLTSSILLIRGESWSIRNCNDVTSETQSWLCIVWCV